MNRIELEVDVVERRDLSVPLGIWTTVVLTESENEHSLRRPITIELREDCAFSARVGGKVRITIEVLETEQNGGHDETTFTCSHQHCDSI